MRILIIGIDFDDTVVKDAYPEIGEDIGAVPVLKELTNKGHLLILTTLRADTEVQDENGVLIPDEKGNHLEMAVNWFKDNDIPLYGVQHHPYYPYMRKVPYDLLIDDRALGIPKINGHVNWEEVRKLLVNEGVL